MEIIAHRRNSLQDLRETPVEFGVEVDVRSHGPDLIIHHDPFALGSSFEEWIDIYRHGTLILNVKEEGLEERLLGLMRAKGVERFFFLDQSFPFLIRTSRSGERRCAVRISEYEPIDMALTLAGQVDWVWVDCFTRVPLGEADVGRLVDAQFKICLVSPELQGRSTEEDIRQYQATIASFSSKVAAVCTKRPDLWQEE